VNAKEISAKRFDKSAFGYKADEVDSFLNEIAAEVNELTSQNTELQKKLEILATKLEEYRQDENSMKEALLGAQKLGNTIVREAKEKAEAIIAEAQLKSDDLLREATESSQKQLTLMKKDIEKEQHTLLLTQREVSNFKSKLLALYKSHLDTITSIPEIKEKDSEAVESISSKLVESSAPAPAEAPKTESAAPDPQADSSENGEKTVNENKSGEPVTNTPPLFGGRYPGSRDEAKTGESRFGELRFGRNTPKK
jgi:cell division initiation protein